MTDTIFRIVEKFTMTVESPPPGRDAWFLDYVLRSPKQAGKHLTAGWLAFNSLKEVYRKADDITSAHESFGGMGAQALMLEHLFNLREHTVGEYNWDAVEHLEKLLLPDTQVSFADAYDPQANFRRLDLAVLDFGDLTAWKTREGEPHRMLLDRVFVCEPKAVVFTDIACRYLHLHRERYESLLGPGTCGSYETYLDALLARLQRLYGYTLVAGFYDRWSTVMALVPQGTWPMGSLEPTPESPVGLEIF